MRIIMHHYCLSFGKLIQQALSTEFVPLRFQNNEEDEK